MPNSTLPDSTAETRKHAQLRLDAELRLKQGTAPPTNGWTLSADTLGLLYRLASDPVSAGDALKLLHELQAHQVELDLQHGQLEANEREFADELARYKALFDFAPVGYLVVDLAGRIMEGNLAGAGLLGVGLDEIGGRHIDGFLAAESRPTLAGLLKKLRDAGSSASCQVQAGDSGSCLLRIAASVSPGGEAILMVVSE